jgi:AcrR family transcriptional regulator
MNDDATPKSARRRYHAPIRQAQAELTRRRVLAAARAIFAERSYAAAAMESIAAAAQVSVPTLYTAFGGKAQIITALILGLKDEVNVYEMVRELMANPDPVELLEGAATITVQFNAVAWELLDVLRAGAKADAKLASLWDQVEESRYRDQLTIAQRFAQGGVLPAELTVEAAAGIFWSLTAHDQYRLLVVERGWEERAFQQWLARALRRELLGTGGGGAVGGA